jgi:G3E family GTPase
MIKDEEKIPVFIFTGFLGSGKTTLLKALLDSEGFGETAVLINEFGEVGLDQFLVGDVPVENVILDNGCICCSIRGDLLEAITLLYSKRHSGEIPAFNRLVIETTGLADPAPIISTILNEPKLRNHFQIRKVITTVDMVNINHHLLNEECMNQITAADHLILTKTDLVTEDIHPLITLLETYNSVASIINVQDAINSPGKMMSERVLNIMSNLTEFRSFKPISTDILKPIVASTSSFNVAHSHNGITSFCVVLKTPIDWSIFGIWLSMLLNRHGRDILRIKAILNIRESETPVILHGVQHLIHPPEHIDKWPDNDHNSKVIFILRKLNREDIERSLNTFLDRLKLND